MCVSLHEAPSGFEDIPAPAGTQNVWCLFLIYLAFSRFAKIKLGADDEQPRYNDFTWFSMLFTCGVAVGLYVFGVAEPLYFYVRHTGLQTLDSLRLGSGSGLGSGLGLRLGLRLGLVSRSAAHV